MPSTGQQGDLFIMTEILLPMKIFPSVLLHSPQEKLRRKYIAHGLWECLHGSDTDHVYSYFTGMLFDHVVGMLLRPTRVPKREKNQKYCGAARMTATRRKSTTSAQRSTSISMATWWEEQDSVVFGKWLSRTSVIFIESRVAVTRESHSMIIVMFQKRKAKKCKSVINKPCNENVMKQQHKRPLTGND